MLWGAGCTTTAKKTTTGTTYPVTDPVVNQENVSATQAREASNHRFWHDFVICLWNSLAYSAR